MLIPPRSPSTSGVLDNPLFVSGVGQNPIPRLEAIPECFRAQPGVVGAEESRLEGVPGGIPVGAGTGVGAGAGAPGRGGARGVAEGGGDRGAVVASQTRRQSYHGSPTIPAGPSVSSVAISQMQVKYTVVGFRVVLTRHGPPHVSLKIITVGVGECKELQGQVRGIR